MSRSKLSSSGTRLSASDVNATKRPSGVIDGAQAVVVALDAGAAHVDPLHRCADPFQDEDVEAGVGAARNQVRLSGVEGHEGHRR